MKKILWCRKFNQPCFKCRGFCGEIETNGGCPYLTVIIRYDEDVKEPEINIRWNSYTPYFRVEA